MPDDAISRRRRTEDGGQTPDAELLRLYAEENSEAGSAELVRRHLDLVYSAALLITDRGLDFQGDRVREGFVGRVADRNGIGPLVSPNSHDSLTGLRREEPVNKDLGAKI